MHLSKNARDESNSMLRMVVRQQEILHHPFEKSTSTRDRPAFAACFGTASRG
jgi:hypothetical protein